MDLQELTVLPGFTDSHIHFLEFSRQRLGLALDRAGSLQEALNAVSAAAGRVPGGRWIVGGGWDKNRWPDLPAGAFPQAAQLDQVSGDHPVLLYSRDGHAAWANSRAMELAGIGPATPDPPGGKIVRSPAGDGSGGSAPAGIFLERAQDLFAPALPRPTLREDREALLAGQAALHRLGITAVHTCEGRESLAALQSLQASGELALRVLAHIPEAALPAAASLGLRSGLGGPWLRLGGVKIFMDGSLGSQTAWMWEPYADPQKGWGMATHSEDEFRRVAAAAHEAGFSVTVHAIGDRANAVVLQVLARLHEAEEAGAGPGAEAPALPDRVEHVQCLRPQDRPAFARHGIVASVQPQHYVSDRDLLARYWPTQSAHAYPLRSLWESGAHLCFGSDAPVEPPDPRLGLVAAVHARGEEAVLLPVALAAYTTGPAWAAGRASQQGRLAPGYWADFVAWSGDFFKVPPEEWRRLEPVMTVAGGRVVYDAGVGAGSAPNPHEAP